jgi:hypothetical protein
VQLEARVARFEAPEAETAMGKSLLFYDGVTYELSSDAAKDLLERGIIVVDPPSDIYSLSLEHGIEEVEPFANVVARNDAPRVPRLGRLRVREFSLFGGARQIGNQSINPLAPEEDPPGDR